MRGTPIKPLLALLTLTLTIGSYVDAQPVEIADVKIRPFLQYSGELAPPLAGNELLWNVIAGGGDFPEPITSALVDVTVSGREKITRPGRTVDLVIRNEKTLRVLERQKTYLRLPGPDGKIHLGFWLHAIGCEPLLLTASIGKSSKTTSLPFRCGE